jgi:hypothetical protein
MHPQMTRLYKIALESHGIRGPAALARALNATPQTVTNWETRGISRQGLLVAQSKLKVAAEWLEHGVGAALVQDSPSVLPASLGTTRIPVMDANTYKVGAGFDSTNPLEYLMTDLEVSPKSFALGIVDLSMATEFSPGDRVIIDPDVNPMPGDYVAAVVGSQPMMFRKYRPRGESDDGTIFELAPLNDDYPKHRSDLERIHVEGVMVEHRKYRRR